MTQFLAQLHFPAPALLGVVATLNESFVAVFIALGFLTRLFSLIASTAMIVAFCVSWSLHEDVVRALLYASIFLTVFVTGGGSISVDHLIERSVRGPRALGAAG